MTQIALFGTSADPPSIAHREILRWLSRRFDRVAVWAADNPLKTHQTLLKHRSAMLRLTIEDLKQPDGTSKGVENIECYPQLSDPRTLNSVGKARQYWPDADLYLAIGADLVFQLPQWYRAAELLQQVGIVVVPRPGCPMELEDLDRLRKACPVEIADLKMPDVSSSSYRTTKDPQTITMRVAEYIDREHLYS
ncbi:nicotinate-nucleotide adenylyltransferase [Oscillatoriales cyanobacterium LEGE 11467]|uniref:nicotinate-nucleotide adenylyltransferase n=1 Tax=Zarconia navalis LEGE 11467 TaxID=1828826 RepID=A0A928W226_9CYAN|nr:nicotinate-nucleotide adenylyltransferase [Zarconia navalis]MBE9041805.1 nicotinate-nucleotide adenylyltransferase [Zarconia navalis LEGE 11467]